MGKPPVEPPLPEPPPQEPPVKGPKGPRTPYPANDPGITDLPGSEPDYVPGKPAEPATF